MSDATDTGVLETPTSDIDASVEEACQIDVEAIAGTDAVKPPAYELRVSRDKLTVRLDCPEPHSQLSTTIVQVMADFKKLEIPEYPDKEQLTSILEDSCEPGQHLVDYPIIMGIEPVPSTDGRLEWARDFFAEGWKMDELTGAVDFWQKLEERSVREGELLVTLHPPVPGEPGLNVFGNDIPVDKPVNMKLRCAKGARTEEEEDLVLYYATCNGRIRFQDGTVAVDDTYIIKNNVGLETGNINHTGTVIIGGDIESGATIDADGDILIKGMAESCDIRCGGSLTVAGGLLGDRDHSIEVGSDLRAKYISEAIVRVEGDVVVLNEIAHSDIRLRGRVTVEKGRIAGGTIVARRGIRVAEAGASGAVITSLTAGVDYTLSERVRAYNDKIAGLEAAQKKLNGAIGTVRRGPDAKTPKKKALLAELTKKLAVVNEAIGSLVAQIEAVTKEAMADAVEEVLILREIWSGTTIQLGDYRLNVTKSVEKPRIARRSRDKVRLLPLGDGNMPDD